jgi:hypothetical protein
MPTWFSATARRSPGPRVCSATRFPNASSVPDLAPLLLRIATEKNRRLFFLGAAADAADQVVAKLKATHPKLNVAGAAPNSLNLLEHGPRGCPQAHR